jgi:UDP-hydrolysing UDP-N-acetyl-D-glucosamine 2-epimerase
MGLYYTEGFKMKQKICVVVASRANYGRVKSVLKSLNENPEIDLQLIVGASTLLERFGKAIDVIKGDGFQPVRTIHYIVEGETLSTQAKSTGLGVIELATVFEDLKPDIVVTVADRFETMATAIAATYQNITLAHIQGGEVSGNIDDKVRHAITQLADIHFPSTQESLERVVSMGADKEYVFNYGCPAMDIIQESGTQIDQSIMDQRYNNLGLNVDWKKPYILMIQHPVTTSYGEGYQQVTETLSALSEIRDFQKVVLWPNIDAGSDHVSKGIRTFREEVADKNFAYFMNFSPDDYIKVLANSSCCVGNSSSFIREGSFLGVPAVIVGDRQQGRETGQNVIFAGYEKTEIRDQVLFQVSQKSIAKEDRFGKGDAGIKIANQLTQIRNKKQ